MSDEHVIHVAHEFVPKLLRRKVEAALANRDAFELERKKQMVPYLLANRNATIAYRAKPWYKKGLLSWLFSENTWQGEILSIEETARIPFDHYDRMCAVMSPWRWSGDKGHRFDPAIFGPHHKAISKLVDEIQRGSKWIDHIRTLQNNLKHTAPRRVSVSEDVLTSITRWAARGQP